MIPFTARKLYVDAVDECGTVWIFYFLDVRSVFFRQRLAGVEMYPRRGKAIFRRPVRTPDWPAGPRQNASLTFRMDVEDGPIEFSAVSLLPPWFPAGPPMVVPVRWHVVSPRLAVKLRSANFPHGLHGVGYADCVEIRALPRSLDLGRLRWGRIHGADETFIFTAVVPQRGDPWQHAALWQRNKAAREWNAFRVEERANGVTLVTTGSSHVSACESFLGNEWTLRNGDATDSDRLPRPAERLLYRLMMGRTAERRWAGSARLNGKDFGLGAAIHELVDFGKWPGAGAC
jgi:hypothetical protein